MSLNWRKAATFVGALAYIEIGARIGVIGVDHVALFNYMNQTGSSGGLLGLYAFLAGGGLFRAGVTALSFMPYVTARIYMRLARVVSPTIAALETDERVKRTRWLTGALAFVQSIGFAMFLQRVPNAVASPGLGFMTTTVLTLTGASLIAMWFGEKLTESDDDEVEVNAAMPPSASEQPMLPGSVGVETIVPKAEVTRIATD